MKPPTMPRRRRAMPANRGAFVDARTLASLKKSARRANALYWLLILGPVLVFAAMLALALVPVFTK